MLHLRVSGVASQPTIMFLHGIGTSGWMWEDQFRRLTGFHCVAVDLPGHGLSRSVRWHSMERTADLVGDVIRAEVPGRKAHIVGLSLGAYVGLTLLSRNQEVADRAVLSGLNVLPLPNPWMMTVMGYLMAPILKTSAGARMNARALKVPDDHFEGYRKSLQQLSMQGFMAASRDAGAYSMPTGTANIRTPTLLIAGEREHALIQRSMDALAAVLPHAEKRFANSLGHGWNGEAPELFAATVRAWCDGARLPDVLLDHVPQ
ncbi:alpha/beta hydrolase [Mesorhizobium sp. PAMC28654]|uniref:alpha/beta fold hydrolase n=1 Tax=Mesorhizobium sp. PAMC28654 TaxID=2880934 RepID=UPI001D0A2D66|nr:alpha/beta hydrolase [Mesorhizobium sp. PAMC28654]UDL90395.1 alpha/beta hydrolase [Mesorhizobium sp. PAMC28654]